MKVKDQSQKGFLITCDKNRQKNAVRDAYNILNQYIDEEYTDVTAEHIRKKIQTDGKQVNLENQMAYTKKSQNRLLSQIETNVNCVFFVKINPIYKQIDPNVIVKKLMKDVHQNGREVTRFCHRILPVQRAFKAQHFRMRDEIDELFEIRGTKQVKSWYLNFKCRNNNKFIYKQILNQCQTIAKKYGHFVDVYYPQWTISIEIVNHLMCLSISQNFKETNEFKMHTKKHVEKEKTETPKRQIYKIGRKKQEKQSAQGIEGEGQKQEKESKEKQHQQKDNSKLLVEKIEIKQDDVDLF